MNASLDVDVGHLLKPLENHLRTAYAIRSTILPFKQILLGAITPVIFLHQSQDLLAQYHHAILAALALFNPDLHALSMDVRESNVHNLTHAKSTAVSHIQYQPMLRIFYLCKNLFDVFLIQYFR